MYLDNQLKIVGLVAVARSLAAREPMPKWHRNTNYVISITWHTTPDATTRSVPNTQGTPLLSLNLKETVTRLLHHGKHRNWWTQPRNSNNLPTTWFEFDGMRSPYFTFVISSTKVNMVLTVTFYSFMISMNIPQPAHQCYLWGVCCGIKGCSKYVIYSVSLLCFMWCSQGLLKILVRYECITQNCILYYSTAQTTE